MGSALHQLCPRYSGTLTPTAPTAIKLWDTFTFFTLILSMGKDNFRTCVKENKNAAGALKISISLLLSQTFYEYNGSSNSSLHETDNRHLL